MLKAKFQALRQLGIKKPQSLSMATRLAVTKWLAGTRKRTATAQLTRLGKRLFLTLPRPTKTRQPSMLCGKFKVTPSLL